MRVVRIGLNVVAERNTAENGSHLCEQTLNTFNTHTERLTVRQNLKTRTRIHTLCSAAHQLSSKSREEYFALNLTIYIYVHRWWEPHSSLYDQTRDTIYICESDIVEGKRELALSPSCRDSRCVWRTERYTATVRSIDHQYICGKCGRSVGHVHNIPNIRNAPHRVTHRICDEMTIIGRLIFFWLKHKEFLNGDELNVKRSQKGI